ncbi:MAG TPA: hypothetical protein VGO50_05005 [Pyrinomonadaceae bacterium]|jgi:uncharacterized delta-60 repeat protein|nr:hypothetical protein [Pyrinomonadaceae bacterium]
MKSLLTSFLTIGFVLTSGVLAQPELDTAFNSTGKVIVNSDMAYTEDMVVQPDNKVVMVAGQCFSSGSPANRPFCLVRLNENGSLDTTFGNNGQVYTLAIGGRAYGLALQKDGKIVVVGYGIFSSAEYLTIVRHNPDGSLDPSFGNGGIGVYDINPGENDRAQSVAIQPDGKILVIGNSTRNGPQSEAQQFIARYLPNGAIDGSFGNGGIVRTVLGASNVGIVIKLQPDGKIVTGGYGNSGSIYSFILARFNPDGSSDATWDGDGVLTDTSPVSTYIYGLAIQLDGRVVAVGGNVLYRFNTDGSPDTSFDGDGKRPALDVGFARDVMVSAGGRITVSGGTSMPFYLTYYYNIAKYRPDGSPDTNFSGDGFLNFDLANNDSEADAVAMDSQGRTVLGGLSGSGIPTVPFQQARFSAARLVAPRTVGPVGLSGRVTRADGQPVAGAVLILQGGSTIMTALTSPFGYYSFADVPSGEAYAISPGSKKVMFDDRNVFVDDEVSNFNIISEPMADTGKRPVASAVKIGPLTK